ncbi:Hsp20/alpha crystallin family protein [Methanohalobium sp.]|uniref:Hsp20/alpha crystallin family protein n=1 Tax=Methanohalobium sp. TaxID=2837493 RepID=UPI0025E6ABC4|nr:Hsp20/alpha crystallin family protein [Methanohalobium sp.]
MAEMIRRGSTGIRRRDPFEEIRETQDYLSDLFNRFALGGFSGVTGTTFSPLVDVKEEDKNVVVTADMPGIDKNGVDITVRDDTLEISAKRSEESETEEKGYYRKERTYSEFYRTVPLPVTVDEENASAKLEGGVLKVTLPKSEKEQEHKITVE